MNLRTLQTALWLTLCCVSARTAAQDGDGVSLHFFEQRIRPLLTSHCLECHTAEGDSPSGNLELDSREGWMRGGDLGQAIVPGDPDGSLLIEAVEQKGDRLRMPPEGRLSAREIADLRHWIAQGAVDPRQHGAAKTVQPAWSMEDGRDYWAFQPLRPAVQSPVEPAVDDAMAHPIDRLMQAAWTRQGLVPSPIADRTTLIRRATLDLTGLPPTAAEVEAFAADESPDAYDRLLDRLLASPRYGERWGRHWLDVARYADSNGLDENIAHGNAWRYRDYVIASFNDDQPFDQFVLEQLAGDLLPASNDRDAVTTRKIATGFLLLGPKVLAEVDETKMELDIIDEQVETFGRAFLGLTLGCARCHDHKFDPIRISDYYALAGVFKSTQTMEHFTKIARWKEVSVATDNEQDRFDRQQQTLKDLKQQLEQGTAQQAQAKAQAEAPPADRPPSPVAGVQAAAAVVADATAAAEAAEIAARIQHLKDQIATIEGSLFELPTTMAVADYEKPQDLPVHVRGNHLTLGQVVPRAVPQVFESVQQLPPPRLPADGSGRLELAQWLVEPEHPLTARVLVNRLWRWHLGRGLVESTDNFGRLGDEPWNPELLDWLATEFIRGEWSIKHMHRVIMTSATYRLSSDDDDDNAAVDPDNRFLWRGNVRRLEAEAIRDSLLAVSGSLDLSMGGSLLHVKNREFLFDHTSKDETRYDAPRRSVYLPVIRNHLYDVFQLFDFADASVMNSNRATTTVAPQALFMLNGDLMLAAADSMAAQLLSDRPVGQQGASRATASDRERIERGYRLAFGRAPTPGEGERDARYLDLLREQLHGEQARRDAAERQAWSWLCQCWLASNEFVYVR